jgi:hypothetical protein
VLAYSAQDASNFIKVASNGVIIYFQKRVAGVDEFVCYTITPVAGTTYAIDAWFNSDNTMGLKINGVSAGSGLGSELVTSGDMSSSTGWLGNGAGGWLIGGGVCQHTAGSAGSLTQPILTTGRAYSHSLLMGGRSASSVIMLLGYTTGPSVTANGAISWSGIVTGTGVGSTKIDHYPGTAFDGYIDNVSVKEIYNSSTTLAPILGTNLFIGSDGTNAINGQIKDFEIRS